MGHRKRDMEAIERKGYQYYVLYYPWQISHFSVLHHISVRDM